MAISVSFRTSRAHRGMLSHERCRTKPHSWDESSHREQSAANALRAPGYRKLPNVPTRHGPAFCDLSTAALEQIDAISSAAAYPKGAVLFIEGQAPGGVFVICRGRVKLTASSVQG